MAKHQRSRLILGLLFRLLLRLLGWGMATILLFARPLGVTTDNLDLVRLYCRTIFEFEVDIFDIERPHIVAEAVNIEVALFRDQYDPPPLRITK